jgi:hypothetical protein
MRRKQLLFLVLSCLAAIALLLPLGRFLGSGSRSRSAVPEAQKRATSQARLLSDYGKLPLTFEENQGQTDARVKFMARGNGYTVFLSDDETTTLRLIAPSTEPAGPLHRATRSSTSAATTKNPDALVQLSLVGANPHAPVEGNDLQPGRSNYFIGNNPARWQRNVPHFARVKFHGVYPGVDLVYYGNQGRLESDYVLAPGANPGQIGLRIDGARTVKLDAEGALVLATAAGDVVLHKPRAYQDTSEGRQEVAANYVQRGPHLVGFRLAPYDTLKPLIIDPVMVYSTYLGGGAKDFANAIAVDATGNAYVTGFTSSKNPTPFPTHNPLSNQGNLLATGVNAQEAFVTKLDPNGSTLIYSTYLGGVGSSTLDQGTGIAVNANGEAVVVGITAATDFPTMNPILANNPNSSAAVFLTRLNATGSALLYSTYLGGNGRDEGLGIALDSAGIAYITGITTSINFPLTPSAFQTTNKATIASGNTAFISKIDTTITSGLPSLLYSTYLGGTGGDTAQAIAVDSNGNAYITGQTGSTDFPRPLPSPPGLVPFQPALAAGAKINGFIARIDTTVSGSGGLIYSTYLGGSGTATGGGDQGNGIAVDGNQNVYVMGTTGSNDFPVSAGAFQPVNHDSAVGLLDRQAFVARLDTTKSGAASLIYSTYLGGSGSLGDSGAAIVVDSVKNAYVTGHTTSPDFPVSLAPPQRNLQGTGGNAFLTVLNPTGTVPLIFSTYWGGTGREDGAGIALDTASPPKMYIAGGTNSSVLFQTSATAFQKTFGGVEDAFITKFSPASVAGAVSAAPTSLTFGSQTVNTTSAAQTVTLTNGANVALTINKISFAGVNASDFAETSTGATACPVSPATLAAGASCTLSVTFTPSTTTAESATLTIDDTNASGSLQQLVTLTGTGTASGTPDFTVSVTPTSATVTAGATATFTVTVTSVSGFSAAVAAACTGAPPASTCTLAPTSVTPAANGTKTITGTITTTKRTLAPPPLLFRAPPRFPSWLWGFMSLAMAILAAWAATRRATRKLAFGFGVLSLLALTGCSGPIHGGTPANTYTVTVTATSGALKHPKNFSLTVQ